MGWLSEEEICVQLKRFLVFDFMLITFLSFFITGAEASELLFNCDSGNIKYQIFEDERELAYMHSKGGVEDLYIQATKEEALFKMASAPLNAGNVAYIQFSRGDYSYYFYDAITYARDPPLDAIGVMVWRNGVMLSDRACSGNKNGLFSEVYLDIPKVEMDEQVFLKIIDR